MSHAPSIANALNQDCFCITLDRDALHTSLREESGNSLSAEMMQERPHLFSNTAMFMSRAMRDEMVRTVRAIEATVRLPQYRALVQGWAPASAQAAFASSGDLGVFMGYDFHLSAAGPRLIEINTNAGGAFLNAVLASAQRACCKEVELCMPPRVTPAHFDALFLAMFQHEWQLQGRTGLPARVAIVDDQPEEQYLYPEFRLAQQFFQRHGMEAVIADASALVYEGGRLLANGATIDMVYNRVVDFALELPEHAALLQAWQDDAIVLTPNPAVHALLADKRNLALLSDPELLAGWGVAAADLQALGNVLRTELVTPDKAVDLWARRKKLFFKPVAGYGGKAVYRGEKLTRGVWEDIARGGYVAQEYAPPSERMIKIDGHCEARKADIRLYAYNGEVLLTAARLYQGQTTNFRTPGGGFAPVYTL
ncbi:MAG: hypothetical protein Q7V56_04600 [Gammaproteobacteria bacterium]|nr:hypothetical protein [Gammaproteobacteria bacterium]